MFFNRRIIDRDEEEWQIDAARWVIANFGGLEQIRETKLILPTKDYFPTDGEEGDELAVVVWDKIKSHAGMEEWPCELVPQDEMAPHQLSDFMVQKFDNPSPAGTFGLSPDGEQPIPTVTYDAGLTANPMQLIATLAHELAHYLMATSKEAPPGGWEVHEEATDFLTVFMGFGVFSANSAFHFRQFSDGFSQGWESRRSGYLSEAALIHALSLFLVLREAPVAAALEHLKPHLQSLLTRAHKRQLKDPRIAELREM